MTDTLNVKLPPGIINIQLPEISAAAQTVIDENMIRVTEDGDTRITEDGDTRVLDGWEISGAYPEIVVIKIPNGIITIQLPE